MKVVLQHESSLLDLADQLIKSGKAPQLTRTNNAFFELLGRPISSIMEALSIEKKLAKHRSERGWRSGWSSILALPMLAERIPKYDERTGKIECRSTGRELNDFQGVCMLHNSEHYYYTWLKDGARYWRVASVQEISVEYRRC